MKKILLLIIAPFAFFSALFADTVSQEEADRIVLERLNKETQSYTVYAKESVQKEMRIITSTGERLEINYFCWVYYVRYADTNQGRYLIVKEANGNLLEVNAKNDIEPEDLAEWREVGYNPELCHCIMDTLKGDWIWFKTSLEGRGDGYAQFKSVIRILSQNEGESVNYQVFVADTLFYAGSFQIQEGHYILGFRESCSIKLPHEGDRNWWLFKFSGKEEIFFYTGMIGPIPQPFYHYKKIGGE